MITGLSQKNFKVMIRVRPLSSKEKEEISAYEQSHTKKMRSSAPRNSIKLSPSAYSFYAKYYNFPINQVFNISKPDNTIYLADPQYKSIDRRMRAYTYSNVYCWEDCNSAIFDDNLKEDVGKVLQGYNCTILAYGITGSGKTYTVFGKQNSNNSNNTGSLINSVSLKKQSDSKNAGISYQAFEYLLQEKDRLLREEGSNIKKLEFKFSFIEIYNENVRDLLSNDSNKFLNIVEDGKGNTSVSDVTEISVRDLGEINSFINIGTSKRAFASTHANQYSSRSHAILQLQVEIQKVSNHEKIMAKLFIIDLAGSQKIQMLNCSKKMQEGANINKSLLALGNCITTLSENSRKNVVSHIPYRDSKLTRMLKDSLGGNTKTIMIACISPNPFLIEQTTTTLNYALRAQGINKKLIRNCQQEQNEQQEFICIKCKLKQTEKSDNNQTIAKLPLLQNSGVTDQLLEQIYQDIIENAKEGQKLRSLHENTSSQQFAKLQKINQQQRHQLKQVLFTLFTYNKPKLKLQIKQPPREQDNKENFIPLRKSITETDNHAHSTKSQNMSASKSRRRRSHNKFETAKKIETEAF